MVLPVTHSLIACPLGIFHAKRLRISLHISERENLKVCLSHKLFSWTICIDDISKKKKWSRWKTEISLSVPVVNVRYKCLYLVCKIQMYRSVAHSMYRNSIMNIIRTWLNETYIYMYEIFYPSPLGIILKKKGKYYS